MRRGAVIALMLALMPVVATTIDARRASGAAPKWSVSASPNPPGANAAALRGVSCTSANNCVAVGYQLSGNAFKVLIERWNGAKWQIMAGRDKPSTLSILNDVSCLGPTNCFAVGYYYTADRTYKPLIEHWDGKRWSIMSAPSPAGAIIASLDGVSCPKANRCFAVGTSTKPGRDSTLVEQWNGKQWKIVSSPEPAGATFAALSDVECVTATNCFAVGSAGTSTRRALIERWNGAKWQIVASPNPSGSNFVGLSGVSCASATSCMAVGSSAPGSFARTFALRLNRTRWQITSTPSPGGVFSNSLSGVSCPAASTCFAVGSRTPAVTPQTLTERWTAGRWQILSSPNAPAPASSHLADVSCPTPTKCFAVGSGDQTLVARYA